MLPPRIWCSSTPVEPVYYCPCYPSNTVSSGDLKFYAEFQKVASKSLDHCDFFDLQGGSWRSPYQTHNNLNYIQINIFKVSPQRDRNIVVPTFCCLLKNNLSQLIHQNFGHVSIVRLKQMSIKLLMKGLPKHIPDLE